MVKTHTSFLDHLKRNRLFYGLISAMAVSLLVYILYEKQEQKAFAYRLVRMNYKVDGVVTKRVVQHFGRNRKEYIDYKYAVEEEPPVEYEAMSKSAFAFEPQDPIVVFVDTTNHAVSIPADEAMNILGHASYSDLVRMQKEKKHYGWHYEW